MDIRDVLPPLAIEPGTTIETIFSLQAALLREYLKIEKLSPWPYDLNVPANQVTIKDFIARVVEELGEGFESYQNLVELNQNTALNVDNVTSNLFNFNEELADALHFLVETFIVCGIDINYIRDYLLQKYFPTAPEKRDMYSLLAVDSPLVTVSSPGIMHGKANGTEEYNLGGRWVSHSQLNDLSIRCWDVTYQLQLARNTLKNKPWKQSHMISDHSQFRKYLVESFIAFIDLTRSVGISEEGLYHLYYRKNYINQFRIRSKY